MSNDTLVLLAYTLLPSCLVFVVAGLGYYLSRETSPKKSTILPAAALIQTAPPIAPPSVEDEKLCAEIAVLAWKAAKAMRGNQARSLERSVERMLSRMKECGFNLAEYKGQRIFPGSHVKVLDTADGPEDIVLDDLEPEIVRNQKLIHPALVIIGKGKQP